MERIAIIGTGLIGRSWAMVFARAGHAVTMWDAEPRAAAAAQGIIAERLADLAAQGLLADAPDAIAARIGVAPTMEACLAGADFVQENGPERLEPKRAIFAAMDALCPQHVILSSSTSGIPASQFTETLAGRARCLVSHPVNPPYLVPLVELVGAPWTAPETIECTRRIMAAAGMVPVTAHKETRGFVLNRLQAALVAEAFRLVKAGVMSVEDIDACVKHGLGLRWAFMGPFETCDLNAPGGIPDYADRYGPMLHALTEEMPPYDFDAPTVAEVNRQRRENLPTDQVAARSAWRDRELMALLRHKASRT
ncbi:MAG: 3-hydroxyacyl-CoA dehydrogenase [Alphaproteobacteria bacterium]|nr:3-hydroxyacyl-CoA dehydrogenase [Alphaproteobacteria bacterium]